jgi:ribose transport system substrate-binding protein
MSPACQEPAAGSSERNGFIAKYVEPSDDRPPGAEALEPARERTEKMRFGSKGFFVAATATVVLSFAASSASSSTTVSSSSASCIPGRPTAIPPVAGRLPALAQSALGGYPGPVFKSPWIKFKPKRKPPWTIGMSNNQGNLNAQYLLAGMNQVAAKNHKLIKKIVSVTPANPNDVATQIQQMRSLLQQGVDMIFSTLGSPTALNGVINEAAKKGVPVISIEGQSTSKYAVNLQQNPIQFGYDGAAGLVNAMGGKGNLLVVDAIPGLSINTNILAGAQRVFDACGLNIVGHVTGFFDPATAKSAVLTFLAAHPGDKIDGVFQVADMASGVISAFQQSGRSVPPVADQGGTAGSLAYWRDNASKGYQGTGVAIPAQKIGAYTADVGLAMLQGRGLKVTDVPFVAPRITSSNLRKWVLPSWTTSTNALANGPADAIPITKLVNAYFVRHG